MKIGPRFLTGVKCPEVLVRTPGPTPPCEAVLTRTAAQPPVLFNPLELEDQWRSYTSSLKPVKERRARSGNILHTHEQNASQNTVLPFPSGTIFSTKFS